MINVSYKTSASIPIAVVMVGFFALMPNTQETRQTMPATNRRMTPEIAPPYIPGNAVTTNIHDFSRLNQHLSIEMLGWSPEQASETYQRLSSFAADWNYPGMEAYDEI